MSEMPIRYVSKVGKDGWLRVRMDDGSEQSLPYCLKVVLYETKGDRDYFKILEGPYKDKLANVSRKSATESYLTTGVSHLPGGDIKFNKAKQSLWFGGQGPYNAFSGAFDSYTQVANGSYQLAIPDAPHSATRSEYYAYTDFHKTWFRIGLSLSGSRYLHVGEISEGCVTVRAFIYDKTKKPPAGFEDLESVWAKSSPGGIGLPYPAVQAPIGSWNSIYNYLICRRASDQSVGTLVVE